MKTTFIGSHPQNIKSGISEQPHIVSYSNVKHKLRWPNHILQILKIETTSNRRVESKYKKWNIWAKPWLDLAVDGFDVREPEVDGVTFKPYIGLGKGISRVWPGSDWHEFSWFPWTDSILDSRLKLVSIYFSSLNKCWSQFYSNKV